MARAESMLYFLAASIIFIASSKQSERFKLATAGFIIGIGMASKLTFLLMGLIFTVDASTALKSKPSNIIPWLRTITASMIIGFTVTSPYSIIEPSVFMHGVQALMKQYSTEHLPHSNPNTGPIRWASHLALFATGITGVAWLTLRTPLSGSPAWMTGLTAMSVVTYIYFATKPVFFERNISLALMASIIVAYSLPRRRIISFALATSLVIMTYWSVVIMQVAADHGSQNYKWEQENLGSSAKKMWPTTDVRDLLANCGYGIIGVFDYGDDTSLKIKSELGTNPVATRTGKFSLLPTSTLQTYLDATVNYYQCRGAD